MLINSQLVNDMLLFLERDAQTVQFVDSMQHFDGLVVTGLEKGTFCLQTDSSGRPVLTNGKRPWLLYFLKKNKKYQLE